MERPPDQSGFAESGDSRAAQPSATRESLYGLERPDDRLPLFVIVTTDGAGRVLAVGLCDAEDYG